jgi:hypothetical protein
MPGDRHCLGNEVVAGTREITLRKIECSKQAMTSSMMLEYVSME